MTSPQDSQSENEAMWREVLTHGHRSRLAIFPSTPRCTVCQVPFGGVAGKVLKVFGRGASRKSPNLCNK